MRRSAIALAAATLMLSPALALASDAPSLRFGPWTVQPGEITSVRTALDCFDGRATVDVVFSPAGSRKLAALTAEHVGKPLPVRLGDALITKPYVQMPISGGRLRITGGVHDTRADTEALTARLQQALALPALPTQTC